MALWTHQHQPRGRTYSYPAITQRPRVVSSRFLSEDERVSIADLLRAGNGPVTRSTTLAPTLLTLTTRAATAKDPAAQAGRPTNIFVTKQPRRPAAKFATKHQLATPTPSRPQATTPHHTRVWPLTSVTPKRHRVGWTLGCHDDGFVTDLVLAGESSGLGSYASHRLTFSTRVCAIWPRFPNPARRQRGPDKFAPSPGHWMEVSARPTVGGV